MPDTDSWIIKAIEREAMQRARAENEVSTVWRFMGYNQTQVALILSHVLGKVELAPDMTTEQIGDKLRARYR